MLKPFYYDLETDFEFSSQFIIALEFDVIRNDENYVIGGHEALNICFYKKEKKSYFFEVHHDNPRVIGLVRRS